MWLGAERLVSLVMVSGDQYTQYPPLFEHTHTHMCTRDTTKSRLMSAEITVRIALLWFVIVFSLTRSGAPSGARDVGMTHVAPSASASLIQRSTAYWFQL